MIHHITTSTPGKTPVPSDPATADEFDAALNSVVGKYRMGVALTRRELLRLSQACLMLIGREGGN